LIFEEKTIYPIIVTTQRITTVLLVTRAGLGRRDTGNFLVGRLYSLGNFFVYVYRFRLIVSTNINAFSNGIAF
jgi:hypothetical protein